MALVICGSVMECTESRKQCCPHARPHESDLRCKKGCTLQGLKGDKEMKPCVKCILKRKKPTGELASNSR